MTTEEIGAFVMNELQQLDQVAYVRFASVYRQFRDVGSVHVRVKDLLNAKECIVLTCAPRCALDPGRARRAGRRPDHPGHAAHAGRPRARVVR